MDKKVMAAGILGFLIVAFGINKFFLSGGTVDQTTYDEVSVSLGQYYDVLLQAAVAGESAVVTAGLNSEFITDSFKQTAQSTGTYPILICAQQIGATLIIDDIIKKGEDVEVQVANTTTDSENDLYKFIMQDVGGVWKVDSVDC